MLVHGIETNKSLFPLSDTDGGDGVLLHQLLYAQAPVHVIAAVMKAQVPKLGVGSEEDFEHCWYILMRPSWFNQTVLSREGMPDVLSLAVQQGRQEVVELVSLGCSIRM